MESTWLLQCSGSSIVLLLSPGWERHVLPFSLMAASLPGSGKAFLKAPVHPSTVVFFLLCTVLMVE